ncbi:E3 ubiquitin-protein ligase WAVH1-like [Argentina anserina]|uniref:E3 ubiquitin-protein ligase WAVH1-like n=1 Tax=Argentina anserina TaxID=57926 RepID=UPI0021767861|nr:E3 ubiquitin-protein ligase WAVH1-like [Potentilla anserina]
MVTGWRRAFCTSIPKEKQTEVLQCENTNTTNNQSPKIASKFGFFSSSSSSSSNPSTPRLRCRTTAATAPTTPNSSLPNSPKLQCTTTSTSTPKKSTSYSPRLFHKSNPSSPKSPSSFSLLKSTLRLSNKSRCGICLRSVKSGQGTAIFTAECSHSFHFPCVAAHLNKQQLMLCPVCNTTWKELPLLDIVAPIIKPPTDDHSKLRDVKTKALRVYNDDEPLMSPTSVARFNPIPESDEENEAVEFQGFFVNPDVAGVNNSGIRKSVEFSLLPESAVVAVGRSYETYAVVLKVKAPPQEVRATSRRAPIDLVTVVDVSADNSRSRIQATRRALRLVVSSLSDADRLSIVAFSSISKRLLPLRRMTPAGRRSARRIVDALCGVGQGMCVNDALKKAAKVLQDRRERNPVASIMLLSAVANSSQRRASPVVSSTRFPQLDIPVHTVGITGTTDNAFVKCVGGLLSVVVKDVKLQLSLVTGSANAEIAAVYSLTGRPTALGSGSIRLGDLYAGEERELLVELKVPANSAASHSQNAMMSVRSTYRDPSTTNELVCSKERALLVPRSQAVRSSSSTSNPNPNIQRLRNLHVTARAVAESRRFLERNDFSGAYHLLTSARALLLQSSSASAEEFLRGLEAELAELHRGRQQPSVVQRQRVGSGHVEAEKPEPLTPTSAWRAAERLAKVAIMRKSMNRVSDLHGFENARF